MSTQNLLFIFKPVFLLALYSVNLYSNGKRLWKNIRDTSGERLEGHNFEAFLLKKIRREHSQNETSQHSAMLQSDMV